MSGGELKFIPKWVKSPTGGWYHTPKNHHVNGMIALTGYTLLMVYLYKKGEETTFNPKKAYSVETVQRWNEAARISNEAKNS